jgi:RNA polymerase sporulation-specific sigma factor
MRHHLMLVPANRSYLEVADPDADVHEAAVSSIEAARVRRMVRTLPVLERHVIAWRYGLAGQPPLTVREVAARLGIGKSTVADIEARALSRMRGAVGEEEPSADAA